MFYRLKFDKVISSVLDRAHPDIARDKFGFWPAGATAAYCRMGKELGSSPRNAAYVAMAKHFESNTTPFYREKIMSALLDEVANDPEANSDYLILISEQLAKARSDLAD